MSDTKTAAPEDSSVEDEAQPVTESHVNTGRHVEFRATMDRRFDYRYHRSLESDAPDDQMPPRDPETVP